MTAERKKELSGINKEVETLKASLEKLKERLQSVYEDEDEAFCARTDRYNDSIEYEAAKETCNALSEAAYYLGTSISDLETALEKIEAAADYAQQ